MKSVFAPATVLLAILFMSSCSQGERSNGATSGASSSENIEQTLMKLHAEWSKVPLSGDTSVFERILSPDFVYIADDPEHLSEGNKFTKREYIAYEAHVGKDTNKYSTAENRNLKVRAYGDDFAVSTGDYHVAGFDQQGKEFDRISRFINVWVRRNGSWQAVAAQNTWLQTNR